MFAGVDIEALRPLLSACRERTLMAGETLFEHGSEARELHLVLSGQLGVQLLSDEEEPVLAAVLGAGDCAGELSCIDGGPEDARVFALEDTLLWCLDAQTLRRLMQSSAHIAANMLAVLAASRRSAYVLLLRLQRQSREHQRNANIDPLTGLYNRRWLDAFLPRIMQRLRSDGQTLTVLMIDIDHFKRYNDRQGHVAGDMALQTITGLIVERLRPVDMVARYGGEEFLAILPNTNATRAHDIVALRLHATINRTPLPLPDGKGTHAPLTISVGLGQMRAGQSPEALIAAADDALYRAKHQGRNRTCS